uniref:Uncharacterized protein n=1 Tax=Strigamia maritima TaxID=126957 RepID=T1J755_STRMM
MEGRATRVRRQRREAQRWSNQLEDCHFTRPRVATNPLCGLGWVIMGLEAVGIFVSFRKLTLFLGKLTLFLGKLTLFLGKLTLFLGKLTLFLGKLTLFLGNLTLFLGKLTLFLGKLTLFLGKLTLFLGKLTLFLGNGVLIEKKIRKYLSIGCNEVRSGMAPNIHIDFYAHTHHYLLKECLSQFSTFSLSKK